MKILYFSNLNIKNNKSWSGIPKAIYDILVKNNQKVTILVLNNPVFRLLNIFQKLINFFLNNKGSSIRGYFPNIYANIMVKIYIYIIKPDVIFSPTTILFRYIKKSTVINVALCDTLLPGFRKYYKGYDRKYYKQDLISEGKCLENIDYLIVPTNWCKQQTLKFDTESMPIILQSFFGSNLRKHPKVKTVSSMIKKRSINKQIVITTIIKDKISSYRKGIDITIDVCKSLMQKGFTVKLNIIGEVTNNIIRKLKFLKIQSVITGKLDKSKDKEYKIFHTIMSDTTFFFLPSRGEAYGIAVCEAMAFGIPCFVSNNGGIAEIIVDKISGKVIKKSKTNFQVVNFCEKIFLSKKNYLRISLNAIKRHDEFLNWQSFYQSSFKKILNTVKKKN